MLRLVQLSDENRNPCRTVAIVDGDRLRVLQGLETVYGLAQRAIGKGKSLAQTISEKPVLETIDYDNVYQ